MKKKMNTIDMKNVLSFSLFYPSVLVVGILMAFFLSLRLMNLVAEQNRNTAIDACYKVSLYRNVTEKDKNVITTEDAIEPSLRKCLDLKNIK